MSITTTRLAFPPPRAAASTPTSPCTVCGSPISLPDLEAMQRAQDRITELESQIKVLTLRATSAVERANEYENEVRRLSNAAARSPPLISPNPSSAPPNISAIASSPPPSPPRSAANRLVRLLSTRSVASTGSVRSTSPATPGFPPPNLTLLHEAAQGEDKSLREALTHEQARRKEAESQSARKDMEIEELSAQLFEQANEMVATERKARAKLENRVEVLEKRDHDKAQRLGLLEMRVQRAERVRALLLREVKVDDDDKENEETDEGNKAREAQEKSQGAR